MAPTPTLKQEPVVDPSLLLPADSDVAQKLKKPSLETITGVRRAFAWQLARWPLEKNVIWDRAKIHLPRSYLSKDGEDIRAIHPGSDINQVVHHHYLEEVNPKNDAWVNFVHADKVVSKRYDSKCSQWRATEAK